MAEARLAAKFNREGFPVVDHYTYAMVGDGCLMEGISHEACSMAGSLGLSKLVVLYDDNEITIEGSTDITFREDVPARFRAYGWNVIDVAGGQLTGVRSPRRSRPRSAATRPTLIVCHTTIGFGLPQGGQGLLPRRAPGRGERAGAAQEEPGLARKRALHPARGGLRHAAAEVDFARSRRPRPSGTRCLKAYCAAYPELAEPSGRSGSAKSPSTTLRARRGLLGASSARPWPPARPAASCLTTSGRKLPNLFGGSADLGPSNKTIMKGAGDFSARGLFGQQPALRRPRARDGRHLQRHLPARRPAPLLPRPSSSSATT